MSLRTWIEGSITATLSFGSVIVILAASRGQVVEHRSTEVSPLRVPSWEQFATGRKRFGADSGAVTIVLFSDFQCPYCKRFADDLGDLLRQYPNEISVVFRNLPLARHMHARQAALAGECAAHAGRFVEFHDRLFKRQESIGLEPWTAIAARSGVSDTSRFRRCMSDATTAATLDQDLVAAKKLGMRSIPAAIINGTMVSGANREKLFALVHQEFARAKESKPSADRK